MRRVARTSAWSLRPGLALALVLAACSGRPPAPGIEPTMRDGAIDGAARMDARVSQDARVGLDADATAEPSDARTPFDADPIMESGIEVLDTGPPRDVDVPDGGPDSGRCQPGDDFDFCSCAPSPWCRDENDCSTGEACLADPGCPGVLRCTRIGAPCQSAADCAPTSACVGGGAVDVCRPRAGGCADSRDCPLGFSCDGGTCVDRRIPCQASAECPLGFYCESRLGGGHPFCNRFDRPCNSDDDCFATGRCRDVDGDGRGECVGRGLCTRNSECTDPGEVCGTSSEIAADCGRYGPCRVEQDCADGYSCTDLWGDGLRVCVRDGGSCSLSQRCPARSVCSIGSADETPRCISAPLDPQ